MQLCTSLYEFHIIVLKVTILGQNMLPEESMCYTPVVFDGR